MQVKFHKKDITPDQCIAIESELHSTDAGDRSGQNENQKFMSGFRANREHGTPFSRRMNIIMVQSCNRRNKG